MTANLRRLAEQALASEDELRPDWWELLATSLDGSTFDENDAAYIAAANPQAILALLDDHDNRLHDVAMLTERMLAAERRVAALEKGLRATADLPLVPSVQGPVREAIQKARALLAAAPSEHDALVASGLHECAADCFQTAEETSHDS